MSTLKHVDANLRELCFSHGMDDDELRTLDVVADQPKPLHKNDFLYRDGDKTAAIYAVRSGCIKTMMESANGDEQIVGFHFPGELLGIDGFVNDLHTCNAQALETSRLRCAWKRGFLPCLAEPPAESPSTR